MHFSHLKEGGKKRSIFLCMFLNVSSSPNMLKVISETVTVWYSPALHYAQSRVRRELGYNVNVLITLRMQWVPSVR